MIESFLYQMFFKLSLAISGIISVRFLLFWMDKYLVPERFQNWYDEAGTETIGLYYGLRFIGACLLVGLALS